MITLAIVAALIAAMIELVENLFFYLERALCYVIGYLNDLFDIAAGLETVSVSGEQQTLINYFFGNSTIQTIYWGMALIGIILCFGFAIIAVIRKAYDSRGLVRESLGDILQNLGKSILLILVMNMIMSATITVTNVLMDRVNYLFLNASSFEFDATVTFDSEEYGAMTRCINKIGNYSLNTSYNSRYNINSCYNDIRTDLMKLANKGTFSVTYESYGYDSDGNRYEINTWQSVLQGIYRSVEDITQDQPLDEYNTSLSEAMLKAMDVVRNDASFAALESYKVHYEGTGTGEVVPIDRLVMLIGTMYGDSQKLSKGSGITDYLRAPYYYGSKNIYNLKQVRRDFSLSFGTWNHLTLIITAVYFIFQMLGMVFSAIARIFNMILLYLAAPPIIAATPLDDGGKLKQWRTAMIVQACGLFGTLMSFRLIMIFIPALFSSDIKFFSGSMQDFAARIILLAGALFSVRKGSEIITGIIADNGGMASQRAADGHGDAGSTLMKGVAATKLAGSAVKSVAGLGKWEAGKIFGGSKDSGNEDPTLIDNSGSGSSTSNLPTNNSSIGGGSGSANPTENKSARSSIPSANGAGNSESGDNASESKSNANLPIPNSAIGEGKQPESDSLENETNKEE